MGVTKETEYLQQNVFDRLYFLDFDSEQGERVWVVRGSEWWEGHTQWESHFNLNWRPWLFVLDMVYFSQ